MGKAMKQYNGVLLDGKEMVIEILVSSKEVSAASQPLRGVGGSSGRVGRSSSSSNKTVGSRRMGDGMRNRVRGGWDGSRKGRQPVIKREDLDAEIDAYMSRRAA